MFCCCRIKTKKKNRKRSTFPSTVPRGVCLVALWEEHWYPILSQTESGNHGWQHSILVETNKSPLGLFNSAAFCWISNRIVEAQGFCSYVEAPSFEVVPPRPVIPDHVRSPSTCVCRATRCTSLSLSLSLSLLTLNTKFLFDHPQAGHVPASSKVTSVTN